jgi:hypothetical protein
MSGFDSGSGSSGIVFMAKQFGSILRGFGPPVPQAGVVGDLYIDVTTWNFYEKRIVNGVDDWGHYLFQIPPVYRTALKWYGPSAPPDTIGVPGDYFLQWSGFPNYGMQPLIWGPKQWTGWPENGDGPGTDIASGYGGFVLPVGLQDEGATVDDSASSQLIAIGLTAEYVIPVPVTAQDKDEVLQLGLQSNGQLVTVGLNSLYTAQDEHDL